MSATDPETMCTAGCRPIWERRGDVCAWGNIPSQLGEVGGGGVPGTSPINFSKKNGCKWCILMPFKPIAWSFPFSEEIHCLPWKRMCEEYMKRIFFVHRGDGAKQLLFFSLSWGSSNHLLNFFRKRIQMMLFEINLSGFHVFIFLFIYFILLPSSPELEGLWLSFSWFIGIMLVQKGRTIFPILKEKLFSLKMRNSFLFNSFLSSVKLQYFVPVLCNFYW